MVATARFQAVLYANLAGFLQAAAEYSAGSPLPLLDGPLVRRDLKRLAEVGAPWRPDEPTAHPVAVVEGDPFAAVGRMLAVATGRPLRNVDLKEPIVADEASLTIVVSPGLLSPSLLAAIRGPVGVFTARDLYAGCALLLRTLLDVELDEPLLFDTTQPDLDAGGRLHGMVAEVGRVLEPTQTGQRLAMAGRAHGRECLVVIGESLLCGRTSNSLGNHHTEETPGQAACQHTQECLRRDMVLNPATLRHAREVSASAVVLDACRSVSIGGRLGSGVSLALDALDGTAVMLVGCVGARQGPPETLPFFVGLVASGMAAGTVVDTLNDMATRSSIGLFVLLGDAARAWKGFGRIEALTIDPDTSTVKLEGPRVVAVRTHPEVRNLAVDSAKTQLIPIRVGRGQWWLVHPAGQQIHDTLRVTQSELNYEVVLSRLVYPTLDALDDWVGHGLQPPLKRVAELREEAHAIASRLPQLKSRHGIQTADESLSTLTKELLSLQGDLLDRWLSRVHQGNDRYPETWPEPVIFGTSRTLTCRQCGELAENVPVTAGLNLRLNLFLTVCPECGDLAAGTDGCHWRPTISGPNRAVRGDTPTFQWGIQGVAGPAVVSVGVGASHGRSVGTDFTGQHDAMVLGAPGDTHDFVFDAVATVSNRALADSQTLRLVAVVNGRPMVLNHTLWVGRRNSAR